MRTPTPRTFPDLSDYECVPTQNLCNCHGVFCRDQCRRRPDTSTSNSDNKADDDDDIFGPDEEHANITVAQLSDDNHIELLPLVDELSEENRVHVIEAFELYTLDTRQVVYGINPVRGWTLPAGGLP